MAKREQDAPYEGGRGRCAVLSPAGGGPPEDLHRVLGSRELEVTALRDVFEAMTALALHERRVVWGTCDQIFLLVIVEPDQVPQAQELARAASIYAPHAGLWQYRADASPQLSALVLGEAQPAIEIKTPMGRSSASGSGRIARAAARGPALRLAGSGSAGPARQEESLETLDGDDSDSAITDSVALTAEELAMLLADEPELEDGNGQDDGPDEHSGALER